MINKERGDFKASKRIRATYSWKEELWFSVGIRIYPKIWRQRFISPKKFDVWIEISAFIYERKIIIEHN